MLTREDDIDVHALRRQGWTISAIARHLGKDRKTIPERHQGRVEMFTEFGDAGGGGAR
jgi:IS30 family transposase